MLEILSSHLHNENPLFSLQKPAGGAAVYTTIRFFLPQVVVVICERDLQLQRLMETRQLSERESILLIDTQVRTGMPIKGFHFGKVD